MGLGFGVPVGVSFNFWRVPLDTFAEVATGVGIVPAVPSAGWWVDGAVGLRYYF